MTARVLSLLLMLTPMVSSAVIYKSVDANGQIVYTDQPDRGGKQVTLSPLHEYTSRAIKPSVLDSESARLEISQSEIYPPWEYTQLTLLHPADGETFHNIAGILPIELEVQPRLYPGDELIVTLDDVAVIQQVETRPLAQTEGDVMAPIRIGMTLSNVYRGAHTVQASILREGKSMAGSQSVKIYIHQTSTLLPKKK